MAQLSRAHLSSHNHHSPLTITNGHRDASVRTYGRTDTDTLRSGDDALARGARTRGQDDDTRYGEEEEKKKRKKKKKTRNRYDVQPLLVLVRPTTRRPPVATVAARYAGDDRRRGGEGRLSGSRRLRRRCRCPSTTPPRW